MNPEQNQNVIKMVAETEIDNRVAEAKEKIHKRKNRAIAIVALLGVGLGFGAKQALDEVQGPEIAVVTDAPNAGPELNGIIEVPVGTGDTIYGLAEEYDPKADPREIVSELKQQGITADTLQPGDVIPMPVSREAEVAYEQQDK